MILGRVSGGIEIVTSKDYIINACEKISARIVSKGVVEISEY